LDVFTECSEITIAATLMAANLISFEHALWFGGAEQFYMSDNDEVLNIPISVHLFRILNLDSTQFCAPRQMCWQIEGNELRNVRMMDSDLFCLEMLSWEVIDGMVPALREQIVK
jgi:hypothetical protein